MLCNDRRTPGVVRLHGYRDWLRKLGLRPRESEFVIYDLTSGTEVARMPHATTAYFSLDGKTLVMVTEHTLELYDLPLGKPWLRIIGTALACAGGAFSVAQWVRWQRRKRLALLKPPTEAQRQ